MKNLEIKILRYLNDPILNIHRKDLLLLSKGLIYLRGKKSPETNLGFENYLRYFLRKWKKLYSRIFQEHSCLYWYFSCRDNHFKLEQDLKSIGDITWATECQLYGINLTRDICHFARHILRDTIHLQEIQDTEELRINRAHSLVAEEFEGVTTLYSSSR